MSEDYNRPLASIFVVIDPTRMVQPALEKAEWIASRNGAKLHLFCCVWDDDVGDDGQSSSLIIKRTEDWLTRIADSSRKKGLDVDVAVNWDRNWRERIAVAARDLGVDLIVKTVSRHSLIRRQLMRTSDWVVIRDASCPTLLVDARRPPNARVVLAAIKLKPQDKTHAILNERTLIRARRFQEAFQGELHAVTIYRGDDIYFDRQRFADSCGLPRSHVHAAEGPAAKGIAEVAEQLGADVIVVGCAAGSVPERGVVGGATAQRVVDEVTADVLVVPPA